MAKYSVVGKSVPRVDVLDKVIGKAEFPISVQLPRMLHGKIVRSPYPHAKIISIDASKARKLAGVRAVVTAMDTPPINLGVMYRDRFVFHLTLSSVTSAMPWQQ